MTSFDERPGTSPNNAELDVVGFDFKKKKVYLCEVTTHILGALYKDNKTTVERMVKKHLAQQRYAESNLSDFPEREYMLWSPNVPVATSPRTSRRKRRSRVYGSSSTGNTRSGSKSFA